MRVGFSTGAEPEFEEIAEDVERIGRARRLFAGLAGS